MSCLSFILFMSALEDESFCEKCQSSGSGVSPILWLLFRWWWYKLKRESKKSIKYRLKLAARAHYDGGIMFEMINSVLTYFLHHYDIIIVHHRKLMTLKRKVDINNKEPSTFRITQSQQSICFSWLCLATSLHFCFYFADCHFSAKNRI